jgi:hypothetical protein
MNFLRTIMGLNPYQIQILFYVKGVQNKNNYGNKKLVLDVDNQNIMYVFASKGT